MIDNAKLPTLKDKLLGRENRKAKKAPKEEAKKELPKTAKK